MDKVTRQVTNFSISNYFFAELKEPVRLECKDCNFPRWVHSGDNNIRIACVDMTSYRRFSTGTGYPFPRGSPTGDGIPHAPPGHMYAEMHARMHFWIHNAGTKKLLNKLVKKQDSPTWEIPLWLPHERIWTKHWMTLQAGGVKFVVYRLTETVA